MDKGVIVTAAMAAALACGIGVAPAQAGDAAEAAAANPRQDAATLVIPAPPAGKGQVVFYRKGGFVGSAVACTVHENGRKVSSLGGGRYVVVVAEPGRHQYSVKTEASDALALEVEPDETQFVGCKIKMGMMVGRPDISPSTEAEFRAAKSLRLVDADDMGEGALRPEQLEEARTAGAQPAPAESPAPTQAPGVAETPAPAAAPPATN